MAIAQPTILQTVAWHRRERTIEHVNLSHVVDFYRRYPGESVTYFTRIDVLTDLSTLTLGIDIPPGLDIDHFHAPDDLLTPVPLVQEIGNGSRIDWSADQAIAKGTRWEFEVTATVRQDAASGDVDVQLISDAQLHVCTLGGDVEDVSTGVAVAIAPKGHYLKYMPSIYREDDLMARFLMLFESFWAPIEGQITDIHYLFDPRITPAPLLPWLATWADLVLDQRWPEEKQRRLLRSIVSLYRRRGTRRGLEELLEIYTGVKPLITEHRANNLTLGPSARLGPSVALGKGNVPYTFSVTMRLPPVVAPKSIPLPTDEVQRLETERQRVIETIIEQEKPAHTRYTLHIEQT
jgi:phage tail-like protein